MPIELRLSLHFGHVGRLAGLITGHIFAAVARQFILAVCKWKNNIYLIKLYSFQLLTALIKWSDAIFYDEIAEKKAKDYAIFLFASAQLLRSTEQSLLTAFCE